MDFNAIDKIFDSFQKRPKRTILIISVVAVIALIGVLFGGYLSELGKKFASDNGTKGKAEPSIQIGEIKTGDQSQVFVGGKVIISGVPQEVLQRLLKNLKEKDVAIEERDAKIKEMAEKYKELEMRLEKHSDEDDNAAIAKKNLEKGNFEETEHILRKSIEKNSKDGNLEAASYYAFNLGILKDLQLDSDSAIEFYKKADQLQKNNSEYKDYVKDEESYRKKLLLLEAKKHKQQNNYIGSSDEIPTSTSIDDIGLNNEPDREPCFVNKLNEESVSEMGAEELLKSMLDAVFVLLQKKDLDKKVKRDDLSKIITPMFDFALMAKLTLGKKHWPSLPWEKKEKFTELFTELIKTSYLDKLALYTDGKAIFEQPVQVKKKVHIPTHLISKDSKTSILYKLYQPSNCWKIYDFEIQGVSIIRNYRSQFSQILKNGTIDDLFLKMTSP